MVPVLHQSIIIFSVLEITLRRSPYFENCGTRHIPDSNLWFSDQCAMSIPPRCLFYLFIIFPVLEMWTLAIYIILFPIFLTEPVSLVNSHSFWFWVRPIVHKQWCFSGANCGPAVTGIRTTTLWFANQWWRMMALYLVLVINKYIYIYKLHAY